MISCWRVCPPQTSCNRSVPMLIEIHQHQRAPTCLQLTTIPVLAESFRLGKRLPRHRLAHATKRAVAQVLTSQSTCACNPAVADCATATNAPRTPSGPELANYERAVALHHKPSLEADACSCDARRDPKIAARSQIHRSQTALIYRANGPPARQQADCPVGDRPATSMRFDTSSGGQSQTVPWFCQVGYRGNSGRADLAIGASESDPGCVKTLRGITAPGILSPMIVRRAKKRKNSSSARHYDQIGFRFRTAKVEILCRRGGAG
jgi:hypothetical protein